MLKPNNRRITIECPSRVYDEASRWLGEHAEDNPEANISLLHDPHLTVFHLGKPGALKLDIEAALGAQVDWDVIFADWLVSAEALVELLTRTQPMGLEATIELFEDQRLVVALLKGGHPLLGNALILAYHATYSLLRDCGLSRMDSIDFIEKNPNLKYGIPGQRDFHVSLAKYESSFTPKSHPDILVNLLLWETVVTGTEKIVRS